MLQIFICTSQRHRVTFVFHVLICHKNFPCSLFEEVHLGSSKVKFFIILSVVLLLLLAVLVHLILLVLFLVLLLLMIFALVFFLDSVVLLLRAYVLCNEKVLLLLLHHWMLLLLVGVLLSKLVLLILRNESHLLMVWWSKHLFILGFLGELGWEDFTLDVSIGFDVRNRQGNSLVHKLCIQIFSLDFFLSFSG